MHHIHILRSCSSPCCNLVFIILLFKYTKLIQEYKNAKRAAALQLQLQYHEYFLTNVNIAFLEITPFISPSGCLAGCPIKGDGRSYYHTSYQAQFKGEWSPPVKSSEKVTMNLRRIRTQLKDSTLPCWILYWKGCDLCMWKSEGWKGRDGKHGDCA